jgi:hypothetical protein
VDERLVYATSRSLRRLQLGFVLAAVAVPAAGLAGVIDLDILVVAGALACGVGALMTEQRVRRPLPELALSDRGLEGEFGLLDWSDIERVTVRKPRRRILVHLRPGAPLLRPTREFAKIGHDIHDWRSEGLELVVRHLELGADALAREVERFRAYYAPP